MNPTEKISRFIAEQGMPDTAFATLSGIPKSVLSRILAGKENLTLKQGQRAADAMGVDMGWLYDEQAGWPPPNADDRVILTPAEKEILALAHQVSTRKGVKDETLEAARLRLLGLQPEPILDVRTEERPAKPRGIPYGEMRETEARPTGPSDKKQNRKTR